MNNKISRRQFQSLLMASVGAFAFSRTPYAFASEVEAQPLISQVRRLLQALSFLGTPLPEEDEKKLESAFRELDGKKAVAMIEEVLSQHVLIEVQINPESRVSTTRGKAPAILVEQGWRTFLVKVQNQAADKFALKISSPQGRSMGVTSQTKIRSPFDFTNGAVDPVEARDRWLSVDDWNKQPMTESLTGLELEYRILQLWSRDSGKREAILRADAGWGEQDLGYRSSLPVLFESKASNPIRLRVLDDNGAPTTCSLVVTDQLKRVFPPLGKRALPDLWFQRQIYRHDGESIQLADGDYTLTYTRGPEYVAKQLPVHVSGPKGRTLDIKLERWIRPSDRSYFSGDTHIHAAGCAHYDSPTEGVEPEVMFRQVLGEALDLGDVLTWAPGYYYQKQFFTGHVDTMHDAAMHKGMKMGSNLEPNPNGPLMRYDMEISGFPSSHCGHLVLLRLSEQNYPGASVLEQWPSWNIPVLKWAKAQGAFAGYAHSAGGLNVDSTELPNYLMPRFDSSGANEYIVDVTHEGVLDFISGCDFWPLAELNIWYHTLSCGFRTAFAGETDFPCLSDVAVGGGRTYVKLPNRPEGDAGYDGWVRGLATGNSYFGDGRSHIMDFHLKAVHGVSEGRELDVDGETDVEVTASVYARLESEITESTEAIRKAWIYDRPYWHLERARVEGTRSVYVELVVNGIAVQKKRISADGSLQDIKFTCKIYQSSWIALRIFPSSHTNPQFVIVKEQPVRASLRSARWCREAVDVCWSQKAPRIRTEELNAAKEAYEHARKTYDRIISESADLTR